MQYGLLRREAAFIRAQKEQGSWEKKPQPQWDLELLICNIPVPQVHWSSERKPDNHLHTPEAEGPHGPEHSTIQG